MSIGETRPQTKKELSERIARQTREFLAAGGYIQVIPTGVSGEDLDRKGPQPIRYAKQQTVH